MSEEIVFGEIEMGYAYLVFVPAALATELRETRRALAEAETWGDLRQRLPAHRFEEAVAQVAESVDGEEHDVPADNEPFSTDQLAAFGDGDWPTWPAQHQLEWMPDDVQALAEPAENRFNGEWLEFPPAREAEVVAALRRHGYEVREDHDLVRAASGFEADGT